MQQLVCRKFRPRGRSQHARGFPFVGAVGAVGCGRGPLLNTKVRSCDSKVEGKKAILEDG